MRCFIYRLTYAVVKVLLNITTVSLAADHVGVQRLFEYNQQSLLMRIKIGARHTVKGS